jgi:hypothetical protein
MKTETIVKTVDLVIGQVYYFDHFKDAYGELIKINKNKNEVVFKLKSKESHGYASKSKNIVFSYHNNFEWFLKESEPNPIPNDILKIVEKYGVDKIIELIKN